MPSWWLTSFSWYVLLYYYFTRLGVFMRGIDILYQALHIKVDHIMHLSLAREMPCDREPSIVISAIKILKLLSIFPGF